MPVLTAKEYEQSGRVRPAGQGDQPPALRTKKAPAPPVIEPQPFKAEAPAAPVAPVKRYRMHHPDGTRNDPINCTIEWSDCKVLIENNVAEVPEGIAAEMESRGWMRGLEVTDE